jgi:hypothetical protein
MPGVGSRRPSPPPRPWRTCSTAASAGARIAVQRQGEPLSDVVEALPRRALMPSHVDSFGLRAIHDVITESSRSLSTGLVT